MPFRSIKVQATVHQTHCRKSAAANKQTNKQTNKQARNVPLTKIRRRQMSDLSAIPITYPKHKYTNMHHTMNTTENKTNPQNTRQHNEYLFEHIGYMFRPVNSSSSGLQQNK